MANDLYSRYAAAERLLPSRWNDLVSPGRVTPRWIEGTDRFWYRHKSSGGTRFMLVEPETRRHTTLFDHDAMAASLSVAMGHDVDPSNLPISGIDVRGPDRLHIHAGGKTWLCDPSTSTVTKAVGPAPDRFLESVSPDGRWAVSVRDHNLVLRERASGAERSLTDEGVEDYSFASPPDVSTFRFIREPLRIPVPPAVAWSPDSRRLVTHRIDQRALSFMHYVQSSPPDGGRPRLHSSRYAIAGDEAVATAELLVIDVESGKISWVDCPPVQVGWLSPITRGRVWWSRDSDRIYFVSGDRGERTVRLHEADVDTGSPRQLVEETSGTTVRTHPIDTSYSPPNVRVLRSGETIWWSERSGWGHLYLYGEGGEMRALTAGEWLVRDLVAVDEDARFAVFTAAGREDGLDPYVRQLYRVHLDDGTIGRLSDDGLDHHTTGSPSGRFLVDVTSWVDIPERSRLRDLAGDVVLDLEQADAGRLYQAGWAPPERFTVKAADGTTDLYGLLYPPHDLDPDTEYPVLDDVYPGPQLCAGAIRFCERGTADHAASMAALGFAVVVVDGRGTPLRGKVFQEHCRGSHAGEEIDDHVTAIRQLAATRPWLDIDRVGIYGVSGGGRASAQALLRHPDFFKVAVSACGDHDDRIYHAIWGEKHFGLTSDLGSEAAYLARANALHADRLRGKLLLIHGELDDNVSPSQTLRLADALIAANKDFDLLIIPNAEHLLLMHQAYWLRRRWDYFVRHLQREEPPAYRIADIPIAAETLPFIAEPPG